MEAAVCPPQYLRGVERDTPERNGTKCRDMLSLRITKRSGWSWEGIDRGRVRREVVERNVRAGRMGGYGEGGNNHLLSSALWYHTVE
jgi:hypothetical protein